MNRLERAFVGVVFAHLAAVLVHSVSHAALQVAPETPDAVFIVSVIMIAPVAALAVLRFHRLAASGLLAVALLASFAYGLQGHFIVPGPDHVAIVASNPWTLVFVATAALLGVLEVVGVLVAAFLFREALRTLSGPGEPSR
jgi:uncharacterized membrane protein YhaH (DUF805 family)